MSEKLSKIDNKSDTSVTREENLESDGEIEQVVPEDAHMDAAASFLSQHKDLETSHINVDKLRHKIDRNVVSVLCLLFILAYLDKAIYNYTAVMGIKKDLKLVGNDFSNIATGYAIAHLLMQGPNAYLIQRLPASKWLSFCIFGWGFTTFCTAFVTNTAGMMVCRVILAIFESTIGPSLMLITAMWYTKSEQAPRFALWHAAPGVGQIFGGLMSFAFQYIPKDGRYWTGWRLMFVTLGALTLIVGAITYYWLPDNPMNAKFLSTEEKVALLRHVSVNMTGVTQYKYRPKELIEAIKDPQIYMLVIAGIFVSMSSGLTGTYSTTIIHNMGFTNRQSALLNMPTGIVGIVCNIIIGYGVRRTHNRWLWSVALTFPGIIGSGLLSFLKQPNLPGSLSGLYLIVCIYSITTIVQQWAMSNVSGHTKRAFMAALMSACHGIGNIIGPQTFQEKDRKSNYLPAKITVMISQITCALFFIALWQYYKWENRKRDRKHKIDVVDDESAGVALSTTDSWAGLTDKQNKKFRYIY